MLIELIFRDKNGGYIASCRVAADTPEEASEVISHVLLEVYAKHGPGVHIQPLPVINMV